MTSSAKLTLTKIEKKDMPALYTWFADETFLQYYDYMPPIPQSAAEVDKTISDYNNQDTAEVFAIRLGEDGHIIGLAGFDDIIKPNGVATLFIGIGNTADRGRGYGRQALELLIDYGFKTLDLHRIQLQVLEFNQAAIRLYEKAGFVREGVLREFLIREGRRYDLIMYGLLKKEWQATA